MKKKISLLLCALFMILSLVGCSGQTETATTDTAEMESLAEFLVTNFAQMEVADMEEFKALSEFQLNYTLMSSGLPIDAEVFVSMLDSWMAAEVECGEYISHGEYTVEEKSSSFTVSTLAVYEEREATIAFSFDKEETIESLDVSAKFGIGEILTKAGLNTLLGMGTVFAVLIFLALVISSMKYIPAIIDKLTKKQEAPAAAPAPVVEEVVTVDETDDLELIAVITAAIAAQEGTSTDGFVVRSIRRRPSNKWN